MDEFRITIRQETPTTLSKEQIDLLATRAWLVTQHARLSVSLTLINDKTFKAAFQGYSKLHIPNDRALRDAIPLALQNELRLMHTEFQNTSAALYVDGTSLFLSSANPLRCEAVIARFANPKTFEVSERLVALRLYDQPGPKGATIGALLTDVQQEFNVSCLFLGADCGSENIGGKADMPNSLFLGCFSHMLSNSAKKFKAEELDRVWQAWNGAMTGKGRAKELFAQRIGTAQHGRPYTSNTTRWHCHWTAQESWSHYLEAVPEFLCDLSAQKICPASVKLLQKHFEGDWKQKQWYKELQFSIFALRRLVQATFQLESRAFMAPLVSDILDQVWEYMSTLDLRPFGDTAMALKPVLTHLERCMGRPDQPSSLGKARYSLGLAFFRKAKVLRWDVAKELSFGELYQSITELFSTMGVECPQELRNEVCHFHGFVKTEPFARDSVDWPNLPEYSRNLYLHWMNHADEFKILCQLVAQVALAQPTVTTADRFFSTFKSKMEHQEASLDDWIKLQYFTRFNYQQREKPLLQPL